MVEVTLPYPRNGGVTPLSECAFDGIKSRLLMNWPNYVWSDCAIGVPSPSQLQFHKLWGRCFLSSDRFTFPFAVFGRLWTKTYSLGRL